MQSLIHRPESCSLSPVSRRSEFTRMSGWKTGLSFTRTSLAPCFLSPKIPQKEREEESITGEGGLLSTIVRTTARSQNLYFDNRRWRVSRIG